MTRRRDPRRATVVLAASLCAALSLPACGTGGTGASTEASAPAPAGLTRAVPAVVRSDCRAASRKLASGAVYCPPLVPAGGVRSLNRSSRGKLSIDAHGDEYALNFDSPKLAATDPRQPKAFRRHEGHWLVRATDGTPGDLLRGPGVSVVAHRALHGVDVTLAERRWVAYNLDAGHVFALWRLGNRTYEVSLHGFENRRLVLPMASALIARSALDAR